MQNKEKNEQQSNDITTIIAMLTEIKQQNEVQFQKMDTILEHLINERQKLIEIQQTLVKTKLDKVVVSKPPSSLVTSASSSSSTKAAGPTTIEPYREDRIAIKGRNTFSLNPIIKQVAEELGDRAKWEGNEKIWHVHEKCLEPLKKAFLASGFVKESELVIVERASSKKEDNVVTEKTDAVMAFDD